ncbi:MAG: CHAT domain-containing protein [Pseudomonadales bacterium]
MLLAWTALPGVAAGSIERARALLESQRHLEAYQQFRSLAGTGHADERFRALLGMADAARGLGMNRLALEALRSAQALGGSVPGSERMLQARLGATYLAGGDLARADAALERSLASASPPLEAALRNDLGVLAAELGDHSRAAELFTRSGQAAREAGDAAARATAACNALKSRIADKQLVLDAVFSEAESAVHAMPAGVPKAELQVSLAASYRSAWEQLGFNERPRSRAFDQLQAARVAAEIADDPFLLASAFGHLALLYADEDRLDTALLLAQRAVFEAQRSGLDEIAYRWDWLVGQLQVRSGDLIEARSAYARAVSALNRVRPGMRSAADFSARVAPVYAEYADVLLRLSSDTQVDSDRRALLAETRTVIEDLKQAEVEDYFANACVGSLNEGAAAPENGVALVYPVMLSDRVELLVETVDGVARFSSPVARGEITETIRRFRVNLQNPSRGEAYLAQARRLYEWLIEPLEPALDRGGIDTLVVVPDGALRTVPLGALHDGERFLVDRLAVTVTPSLRYTRTRQEGVDEPVLLVGGLSAEVQGYPALPHVSEEVGALARQYPAKLLTDEAFSLEPVRAAMATGAYNVVHLATHGEFRSDYRQSFLLTFDDRLTLERLEDTLDVRASSGQPLDLLVLSACQTAVGDDRAALGLAGIAIQSGADSALASLWSVSDPGTAELMMRFYANLADGRGKAHSLQLAQQALLAMPRYAHPAYWAPFTLVGSWQ